MKIQFRKPGRLLKTDLIQRERTPAWAVALAFLLYPLGLPLAQETAQVWQGLLPQLIVMDETWVKVAGKDCWIFTPRSRAFRANS